MCLFPSFRSMNHFCWLKCSSIYQRYLRKQTAETQMLERLHCFRPRQLASLFTSDAGLETDKTWAWPKRDWCSFQESIKDFGDQFINICLPCLQMSFSKYTCLFFAVSSMRRFLQVHFHPPCLQVSCQRLWDCKTNDWFVTAGLDGL